MTGATARSWDVIVVGGGSTGAVLAARLAEDPARQVLLLEAGPDVRAGDTPPEMHGGDQWAISDPAQFPQYHWSDLPARTTSAQPPVHYRRGRGVGGTSLINWRIAFRPPLDDFDVWEAAGGTAWAPGSVLGSFVRSEDDLLFGDEPYHGRGGPVPISRLLEDGWSTIDAAMRDAAVGAGVPWSPDLNAPGSAGASMLPYSGVDGARMSMNEAYLEPARGRPNLLVVADALVDRVLLDGARAVGVRAVIDGTPTDVRGDEVVISCGAIHSPAVLQRSGVGPAALLRSLGIGVVADVPVGDGLQDHIAVAIARQLGDGYVGPANGRPFSTCVRFSTGVAGSKAHDVMVQVLSPPSLEPFPFGIWGATLEQPLSTGTVRITAPDRSRNPAIDLRFLTETIDRGRMRLAAARVLELLHEPALTKVCRGEAVPYRVSMDGMPDVSGSLDDLSGDAAVDRWIAETAATSLHASSTCAMGAVVDGSCRVFGIDGLRVADLSIAPVVPRANPNLTAIMIGEHLASMIQAGG